MNYKNCLRISSPTLDESAMRLLVSITPKHATCVLGVESCLRQADSDCVHLHTLFTLGA